MATNLVLSLGLSSSGGGLFDGRRKTETWVWDVFVFGVQVSRRLEKSQ